MTQEPCNHEFAPGSTVCGKCGATREDDPAPTSNKLMLLGLAKVESPPAPDPAAGEVKVFGATDSEPPSKAADMGHGEVRSQIGRKLDEFRQRSKEGPGIVIGVFGPPDAGKSFLNNRLEQVWKARPLHDSDEQKNQVGRTGINQFRLAEFALPPRSVLVVDLPGEGFKGVPQRGGFDGQDIVGTHYIDVINAADAIVLYISVEDIAPGACFAESTYKHASVSKTKQDLYVDFLYAVHQQVKASNKALPPVFVAVSQADRLGAEYVRSTDCWLHVSREAPALATHLLHHWDRFGCGYVASHVGGGWKILNFTPSDAGALKRSDIEPLVLAAIGAADISEALKGFARQCLLMQRPGSEWTTGDVTPQAFSQSVKPSNPAEYNAFCATATKLSSESGRTELGFDGLQKALHTREIDLSVSPRAVPGQRSFGVEEMLKLVLGMLDTPPTAVERTSLIRKRIGSFADLAKPSPVWTWGVKALASRWLRGGAIAVVVAWVVLPLLFLVQLAQSNAAKQRQLIRDTVARIDSLPPGFTLEPNDVWRLPDEALEGIRARLQSEAPMLAPVHDLVVRAPNLAAAETANERATPLNAFIPDWNSESGRKTNTIFRLLNCNGGPRCEFAAGASSAALAGDAQTRPESYARALRTYWTRGDLKLLRADLQDFLTGVNKLWRFEGQAGDATAFLGAAWPDRVGGDRPVKQVLMPLLAVKLMYAHAELRERLATFRLPTDQVAMQDELRRYGGRVIAALEGYRQAYAKLPPSPTRGPSEPRAELAGVGVHVGTLAVHLMQTALVSSDSWVSYRQALETRLKLLGLSLNTDSVIDTALFATEYPELLCLHQHMRRSAGEKQANPAGEACRRIRASADGPFGLQRVLTDPRHWATGPRDLSLPYDEFVVPIREAAARWQPRVMEPRQRQALQQLRDLPTPSGWLQVLFTNYANALVAWVVILVALTLGAGWLLRCRRQVMLILAPYREDRNKTG